MRETTGLILRLRQFGESDILVDLFTRELGRATALAKGGKRSKKRFFGILLTGHLLHMQLAPTRKGSDLWRLDSAHLLTPHLGLRLDHRRLMAAGPVLELLLRGTAAHDPNPQVLDLALITLERLEKAARPSEMVSALNIFLARLLTIMGYGLNLTCCLHCGKQYGETGPAKLSLEGGLVCGCKPHTHGAMEVPPGLFKGLSAAQEMDLTALPRLSLPRNLQGPALDFLSEFWRRIAGHDLPSTHVAGKIKLA